MIGRGPKRTALANCKARGFHLVKYLLHPKIEVGERESDTEKACLREMERIWRLFGHDWTSQRIERRNMK